MKKQVAAVYIRVSTLGQVDGSSLDSQCKQCLDLATADGNQVPD